MASDNLPENAKFLVDHLGYEPDPPDKPDVVFSIKHEKVFTLAYLRETDLAQIKRDHLAPGLRIFGDDLSEGRYRTVNDLFERPGREPKAHS